MTGIIISTSKKQGCCGKLWASKPTNVACFKTFEVGAMCQDVEAVTYYPRILTKENINFIKFINIMNSIGFELNLKFGDKLEYTIDTVTPREKFGGRIPKAWIVGNLILMRYIEEDAGVIKQFLKLIEEFPNEDPWFLFHVSNLFPLKIDHQIGWGHRLPNQGSDWVPFPKIIESLKTSCQWHETADFSYIGKIYCVIGTKWSSLPCNYTLIPGYNVFNAETRQYEVPYGPFVSRIPITELPNNREELTKILKILK